MPAIQLKKSFYIINSGGNTGKGGITIKINPVNLALVTEVRSNFTKSMKEGSSVSLVIGSWHHVLVSVRPEGGFATYLDGQFYHKKIKTSEWLAGRMDSDEALKMCESFYVEQQVECDEFYLWDREFEEDEAMDLYQSYVQ